MKRTRILCLMVLAAGVMSADELHLRDGTMIVGNYIGGSQKEVWFQRNPAGAEVFPLFLVESVKFNTVPTVVPGAASGAPPARHPQLNPPNTVAAALTAQVKWAFALFFPPPVAVQSANPAH